jgi:mono/diheme cytochrome c family protein
VRHFFNLRHQGRTVWAIPATAAAGIAAVAVGIAPGSSGAGGGNAVAGRRVFASAGCSSCHTLRAAGASGKVGPNLDAAKPSAGLVVERVTSGQGVMPSFRDKLSQRQIQDVAAFVSSVAGR